MQTLAAYPYLIIYLHESPQSTLELSWLGYATSQQFREVVQTALTLATTHRITGWISDDRRLGAVRPRDLEWGAGMVVPRLVELGLLRYAQLEPQDALNRLTIDGTYQQAIPGMPFPMHRFTDLAQARAWASGGTT